MNTIHSNNLDVTLLEPRLKHPTIFSYFDKLEGGENFVIHNDHDPKPLYYQLLGERGDVFTWEYLEQGPEWWKVRLTKKLDGEKDETLGEIAAKDLQKAQIFKKYGLDFCCGGKKTVREACAEKGLDVAQIEQELQRAVENSAFVKQPPFNEWGLDFLADYIINTHHTYIRKTLPDIRMYAEKVRKVHGSHHPELIRVHELVEAVASELIPHMTKEEEVLFPYIREMIRTKGTGAVPGASVKQPILVMENEHELVGEFAAALRETSSNYSLPADACASYSLLYRMLDEFEADLHMHIHLENNILFPKAIELENRLTE